MNSRRRYVFARSQACGRNSATMHTFAEFDRAGTALVSRYSG